jgi:hypothetical protein
MIDQVMTTMFEGNQVEGLCEFRTVGIPLTGEGEKCMHHKRDGMRYHVTCRTRGSIPEDCPLRTKPAVKSVEIIKIQEER